MSRVSAYAGWIREQFDRPADTPWPILLSSTDVNGPYTEHDHYAVEPGPKTIIVVDDGKQRFFKLDGATTLKGPVVRPKETWLQFEYE
jgi:hypothetical protein